jgi:hypothetical protein
MAEVVGNRGLATTMPTLLATATQHVLRIWLLLKSTLILDMGPLATSQYGSWLVGAIAKNRVLAFKRPHQGKAN